MRKIRAHRVARDESEYPALMVKFDIQEFGERDLCFDVLRMPQVCLKLIF
jgi:hypothetical protein